MFLIVGFRVILIHDSIENQTIQKLAKIRPAN